MHTLFGAGEAMGAPLAVGVPGRGVRPSVKMKAFVSEVSGGAGKWSIDSAGTVLQVWEVTSTACISSDSAEGARMADPDPHSPRISFPLAQ